jgi:hypothetical protein
VNPALPTGLSFDTLSGVITGNPSLASPAAAYVITARNVAGSVADTLTITVSPGLQPPSNLSYANNPAIYFADAAITPNNPAYGGGAPTGYSVHPALPAGLTLDSATGVISGTPAASSPAADYVVTASNSAGSAADTLNITVNTSLQPPSELSYAASPAVYTERQAIAANNPTVTGTVERYAVTPSLPPGLTLDTASGVITGTPLGPAAAVDYKISASNAAGSDTVVLRITVEAAAPSDLTYPVNPATYPVNEDIPPNIPTVAGRVNNFDITPPLPPGLVLDAVSGMIWGRPTAPVSAADYLVIASNSAGSDTTVLRLEVTSTVVISPPGGPAKFSLRIQGLGILSLPFQPGENLRLEIFDMQGQAAWAGRIPLAAIQKDGIFRPENLPNSGIYFARITSDSRTFLMQNIRSFATRVILP